LKLFADKFSAALSPDRNPFSATLPLVGFQANSRFFTKYYEMALTQFAGSEVNDTLDGRGSLCPAILDGQEKSATSF
jgi:hypothetical protein